jgi:hypothetical protein
MIHSNVIQSTNLRRVFTVWSIRRGTEAIPRRDLVRHARDNFLGETL